MVSSTIERQPSQWPLQIARLLKSPKMLLSVVHNILMIDPPGAGKTLLARAIAYLIGEEHILPTHLAEALQYRPKMRIL